MSVKLEKSEFCLDIFILCLFLPTSFPRSPSIFCSSIKSYCPITLLITNLSCDPLECFKLIDRLHFFVGKTPCMMKRPAIKRSKLLNTLPYRCIST
uniref:Uncharacterized protein n=1 Tax=Moschus moschiferus TaxID=68415 RepID=A0A8C6CW91_MOSMO